ncbi:YicC/YloC family endoribonuclease [uncultured Phascolarctobacterium sp.]|uniref:YicC/YloC family endoribonuclease n=1 Tax=uncultured Phascolarctobacterium sp. TaxID=512296 RepID=UPI002602F41F|nr:YicC/YloC family endoribonuclease [uncultured Phascolarctobacterium sp.]
MLKSMTGFGRGEYEDADFSITVEMKTVNHRYNEVAIRLPRFLNPLEDRIRKTILKTVSRGRIDVFINADYTTSDNCSLKVDKNLAAAYHKALQEVGAAIGAEETGISTAAEILYLSRCQDVINIKEGFFDVESVWPKVEQAVCQALDNLVAMRETEGGNIYGDFIYRADLIAAKLALIEERSPMVVEEYQAKLSERLTNLLADHNITVEPERLLQEVAIFADRTSITEEIVRLKSHIKQFKLIIASDQPVGRKLDFLIQEFNREANTIASKANDYTLAQIVVEIKAEIEKIREQIQNIE